MQTPSLTKVNHFRHHYKNAHIGREHTLCLLRKKYWIPAYCGIIRKILSNCFYCKRVNLRPKAQIMANLPQEHLTFMRNHF